MKVRGQTRRKNVGFKKYKVDEYFREIIKIQKQSLEFDIELPKLNIQTVRTRNAVYSSIVWNQGYMNYHKYEQLGLIGIIKTGNKERNSNNIVAIKMREKNEYQSTNFTLHRERHASDEYV